MAKRQRIPAPVECQMMTAVVAIVVLSKANALLSNSDLDQVLDISSTHITKAIAFRRLSTAMDGY